MRRLLVVMALASTGLLGAPAAAQTVQHYCFGEVADTVGTKFNDPRDGVGHLTGDVVHGLAGSDDLSGRLVCGGKDEDFELFGEYVNGGPGNDREVVGSVLGVGSAGDDKLWELDRDFARQELRGGPGRDHFATGLGDSVMYGGIGNDAFTRYDNEGGGNDRMYGGEGDDFIDAVDSINPDPDTPDYIDGGPGFDTCRGDASDTIVNCEA